MTDGSASGPGSRLGMAIIQWPNEDRRLWHDAFDESTYFSQPTRAEGMAPRTKLNIETCYARWLLWVARVHPDGWAQSPAIRATEARVIAYLHMLKGELALRSVLNYGGRLRDALEILAPDADWSWFDQIVSRIEVAQERLPRKAKPFVPSDELFAYGIELMEAAPNPTLSPIRQAERFRDGLMIAFLAARPLRRFDMLSLIIGESFFETHDSYRVAIAWHVYKTRRAFEFPAPERLAPYLRRYITELRPVLAAGGATAGVGDRHLWLARSGAPLPSDTFADMISRHMLRRFDKRMTPHDFRHCAATTIAEYSPEQAGIIRLILGHTTSRTAERHYIHAKGAAAARAHQQGIMARRKAIGATGTSPW